MKRAGKGWRANWLPPGRGGWGGNGTQPGILQGGRRKTLRMDCAQILMLPEKYVKHTCDSSGTKKHDIQLSKSRRAELMAQIL